MNTESTALVSKEELRQILAIKEGNKRFDGYWERAEALYSEHSRTPVCNAIGRPVYVPIYLGTGERREMLRFRKSEDGLMLFRDDIPKMAALNKVRFNAMGDVIKDQRKYNVQALANFYLKPTVFIKNTVDSRYQRWIRDNLREMGGREAVERIMPWEEFNRIRQMSNIGIEEDKILFALFLPDVEHSKGKLSVSEVLRANRNIKGDLDGRISNRELAEYCNMEQKYVSQIMRGEILPTPKEFERMAKVLSVPQEQRIILSKQLTESPNTVITGTKQVTPAQPTNMDISLNNLMEKYNKKGPTLTR